MRGERSHEGPGATPASVTVVLAAALVGALGAAVLIVANLRLAAGLDALVGGLGLVAGTTAAHATGSRRAMFGAQVLDAVFDASILAALAWVYRATSVRVAVLALIALASSYVASYERARGEALGYRIPGGPAYQPARVAFLVVGLLTGVVELALWTFVVLTGAVAASRAFAVVRQTRSRARRRGAIT